MRVLTQEEYLERCANPKKIEDTHGWGLKSLYSGYSLYRGGVGVSEEYKIYDEEKLDMTKQHEKSRHRMLKHLSYLIFDYLLRQNTITREEFETLTNRVKVMTF